jgi:DNA-binding transcriptional LysR family regulator
MELRHLEYFVAVAEELSFTKASRRMHVVQSGVSSAIQSLERELAAPLFERDRHRVALTDAGRALLPEARATLGAAQAAKDAVGQARDGWGTVTVGTMPLTGTVDLPASGPVPRHAPGRQRAVADLRDWVVGLIRRCRALDLAVPSPPSRQPAPGRAADRAGAAGADLPPGAPAGRPPLVALAETAA